MPRLGIFFIDAGYQMPVCYDARSDSVTASAYHRNSGERAGRILPSSIALLHILYSSGFWDGRRDEYFIRLCRWRAITSSIAMGVEEVIVVITTKSASCRSSFIAASLFCQILSYIHLEWAFSLPIVLLLDYLYALLQGAAAVIRPEDSHRNGNIKT